MEYELRPSTLFLEHIETLSKKAKQQLKKKLDLTKQNPGRNNRIKGYDLFLFRIRLTDQKQELRVIYLLEKNTIKLLCILNRGKEYGELQRMLKQLKNNEEL